MELRRLMVILVAYFAMGITSAFAMSEDKCRTNDWFGVGREWGFKGEPEDKILRDQNDCQKKGVEIAIAEYKKGWEMGIGQYCNPDNAYKLGFAKKSPSKNCPVEHKPTFDQFYGWGKEASKIEKDIKKSDNKLKNKKRDLEKTEKKVSQLQNEVKKFEKENATLKERVATIEKEMATKRMQYKSKAEAAVQAVSAPEKTKTKKK